MSKSAKKSKKLLSPGKYLVKMTTSSKERNSKRAPSPLSPKIDENCWNTFWKYFLHLQLSHGIKYSGRYWYWGLRNLQDEILDFFTIFFWKITRPIDTIVRSKFFKKKFRKNHTSRRYHCKGVKFTPNLKKYFFVFRKFRLGG